jgi:hypothetical protein
MAVDDLVPSPASLDLTTHEWDSFVASTFALQHGILREVRVSGDSYVDKEFGARIADGCEVFVLVQLQERSMPAVLLRFSGVSRFDFKPLYDRPPERLAAGREWEFRLLSISISARGARSIALGASALGTDVTIESLLADPFS